MVGFKVQGCTREEGKKLKQRMECRYEGLLSKQDTWAEAKSIRNKPSQLLLAVFYVHSCILGSSSAITGWLCFSSCTNEGFIECEA